MAMKQLSQAVAVAAMAMSGAVLADAPSLKEVLDASGITVTGYVDAAYSHYNIDPADQTAILNYFDDTKDTFSLKQASVTIASQPKEGFGALVNLTAGNDADKIHSNPVTTSSFDVTQAFVQYATGPITAMAGKFNTLAGAEVIAPTGNTNISRSIAFLYALPFTHTGARLAYAPVDGLTLYAGLNNGWDQQKDLNNSKTLELGVSWVASDMVSLTLQGYSGKEPITDPMTGNTVDTNRLLVDTVLTIKPTSALSLVLNYDYGKQKDAVLNGAGTDAKDAKWTAIIGYINYQFTDEWRTSLRLEQFNDEDGYRIGYTDQDPTSSSFGDLSKKTKAVTLTVGYAPSANFELRGEVRQDKTDKDALIDGNSTTDKETFVAVEALYKF